MTFHSAKFRALKTASFFALLIAGAQAAPKSENVNGFWGVAGYSTGQSEFGLMNFYTSLGHPLPKGFYVKGKLLNFMLLHDARGLPRAASFEALIPGGLVFLPFFTEEPEDFGLFLYLFALTNGEVGFTRGNISLGIVNGVHPFFTRSEPYHDAGFRLGIGKQKEFGISIYEQDRMRFSDINYGIRVDFQFYLMP